jgi:ribonuclease D
LNRLLEIYLGVQNTKKENIKKYMMEDDEFWERRPLSSEMLEYASQDVFYLPMVYGKMQQYFHGKTNHRFY